MITVAIATRTIDRQRRYRSLLPAEQFAIVSALDCPTLAQLVKNRPVDVIIFDIQRPSMPTEEWLDLVASDPDLGLIPIAWVGRDVPATAFENLRAVANSGIVPPRPDSQKLVQALVQLVENSRRNARVSRAGGQSGWEPEEDIIENALSIFDRAEDSPIQNQPDASPDEWLVSELVGEPPKDSSNPAGEGNGVPEPPKNVQELPEESCITLNSEEIDTGSFGVAPGEKNTTSHHKLVNEKIIENTTGARGMPLNAEHVERITREILTKLSARLADEIASRIDHQLVRRTVEQVLAARDISSKSSTSVP